MAIRIQLRRDISTVWSSVNPILLLGEYGLETDTGKQKLGDGVKTWLLLPYFTGFLDTTSFSGSLSAADDTVQKAFNTLDNLSFADTDASYLTLANTSSLNSERALVVSTGLKSVDGGVNSSYTLSINDNITATISGSTFTGVTKHNLGMSGSLTNLVDGKSYLAQGQNISIISESNGQVRIDVNVTDNTLNNVSTASHGFLPKLSAPLGKYLQDNLTWNYPVVSASNVLVDVTNFSGTGSLSYLDTNVQIALNTLDNRVTVGSAAGPIGIFANALIFNTSSITTPDVGVHLYNNDIYSGSIKKYIIPGNTFSLPDRQLSYLVGDYNSGSYLQRLTTNVDEVNESNIVPIYTLYRSGSLLHTISWDSIGQGLTNRMHQRLVKVERFAREYGLMLGEGASNEITLTAGTVWLGAARIPLVVTNSISSLAYLYVYNGSSWNISRINTYNRTQYQGPTGLVSLGGGGNHWTTNWIYRSVNDNAGSELLIVILGGADYGSLTAAALAGSPQIVPDVVSSHSILVGRIIAKKNTVPAAEIDSSFTKTLTAANVTDHNLLTNIQGGDGTLNQYYHLSLTEYTKVLNLSASNADINASYLTLANTASLNSERALVISTGLKSVDAGANSSYTLSINDDITATISGSTFTGATKHNLGLSGSLTNLVDGRSYIAPGVNIYVNSQSNGQIVIGAIGIIAGNIDGGRADTIYGGVLPIDCGGS